MNKKPDMDSVCGGIVKLLKERPEQWMFTEHTADHDGGLRIWTAGFPLTDLHIYGPVDLGIPLRWRRKIWSAVKTAKLNAINKLLKPKK